MKAIEMVRRLAELLETQKVADSEGHAIFNGCHVTTQDGSGVYRNGNLELAHGVIPISPDRVTDVSWPKPVAPEPKPKFKPLIRKSDKK